MMLHERTVVARNGPCLRFPNCRRFAFVRGLCRSCYEAYRIELKAGRITEERAMEEGKILPRYGGKQTARSWFSEVKFAG
jgi:hypothetical protein